jgi:hypothetical protein
MSAAPHAFQLLTADGAQLDVHVDDELFSVQLRDGAGGDATFVAQHHIGLTFRDVLNLTRNVDDDDDIIQVRLRGRSRTFVAVHKAPGSKFAIRMTVGSDRDAQRPITTIITSAEATELDFELEIAFRRPAANA